ncbi:hypothetical protein [Streptomyces sp. NPDC093544]|uniref:hypothetical protein n=1 Tax=Streptomyces sp. NPDC093544 TaxID=3155200 RepID=UPI0034176BA7
MLVEFGVNQKTLHTWVRRSEQEDARAGGLSADDRDEPALLRKVRISAARSRATSPAVARAAR